MIVIFFSLIIAYYSLVPVEPSASTNIIGDKGLHMLAYAVLSLAYFNAFQKKVLHSIIFAASYGILIEILQGFTFYREMSIFDAIANIIGASVAVVIAKNVEFKKLVKW